MTKIVPGNLSITNEVIADLAGHAAMESYGVVGMTAPTLSDGIAKILPKQRLRRGIKVETAENGVKIDLYVVIEHGTNLTTVSKNLVDQVTFVLENYAQVPIDSIEVHVQDVKVRN
ncbi:MAG: Asp23/Gls24 family envelope stress response protein [Actinobacteria bacterium]|nr:Asp23/Gls24 family envelope stress response protein [Actinomycetota bacterium]